MHKADTGLVPAGFVLEGTLIVAEDDSYVSYLEGCTAPRRDENQLHAAIVELVDKWHYGKNESEAPAEIIVFYAGVHGEPITVKE